MGIVRKIRNAGDVMLSEIMDLAKREADFHRVKPRTAILILTYRCDSRCKTCTMWRRDAEIELQKEIDLKGWKSVVDRLCDEGIEVFELFGGNVLLRKDLLIPLLKYLYDKGASIHIPTNQIGLDDEIADALVRYADTVYLSTDGIGNEQDSIRGISGSHNIGKDAVDRLLIRRRGTRRERGSLRIVCNCTVSKYNFDSLEKIVRYAEEKCFDEVHFEYAGEFDKKLVDRSKIMDVTPEPHYLKQEESILVTRDQAIKVKQDLRSIRKKYRNSSIKITTLNIDSMSIRNLHEGSIPHDKCYIERCETTIDPYGNLVACPFITNFKFGNILDAPFHDVWNGNRHKLFRQAQNSQRLPMCGSCILGVQWNHGIFKTVHRIYLSRFKPLFA
jgi:MoaA/NifB/PqqE/SkfB family radical SAM enzyme